MNVLDQPSQSGLALIPVAIGELMDKVTILEIKTERISDPVKLANVGELDLLRRARREIAMETVAQNELTSEPQISERNIVVHRR